MAAYMNIKMVVSAITAYGNFTQTQKKVHAKKGLEDKVLPDFKPLDIASIEGDEVELGKAKFPRICFHRETITKVVDTINDRIGESPVLNILGKNTETEKFISLPFLINKMQEVSRV